MLSTEEDVMVLNVRDVPRGLVNETKAKAALRGSSVREAVIQGLRLYCADNPVAPAVAVLKLERDVIVGPGSPSGEAAPARKRQRVAPADTPPSDVTDAGSTPVPDPSSQVWPPDMKKRDADPEKGSKLHTPWSSPGVAEKVVSRCPNSGHTGFTKDGGWWCMDCRRMY